MEDLMLQSDCFGECLGIAQDTFEDKKNYYLYNPAFDCGCNGKK